MDEKPYATLGQLADLRVEVQSLANSLKSAQSLRVPLLCVAAALAVMAAVQVILTIQIVKIGKTTVSIDEKLNPFENIYGSESHE